MLMVCQINPLPFYQPIRKKMKPYFTLCLLAAFAVCNITKAQTAKPNENLLPPPPKVVIDGNLNDWGDSLRYYNEEKKLNYTLANDNQNLYAVIRVSDRLEQARILNAGLTLSIDTRGKKKETFKVTFPLRDPGSIPEFRQRKNDDDGEITKEDRDELMRERITILRNIKVEGFKDIEYDMISTSNNYGFKAAVNYDADGNLVCEAAIPIKFFHADNPAKSEWAFNFKINGLQKPTTDTGGDMQANAGGRGGRGGGGMGGGRSGMGGGGRSGHGGGMGRGGNASGGADRSEIFKSEDFWEKFYLSKQ